MRNLEAGEVAAVKGEGMKEESDVVRVTDKKDDPSVYSRLLCILPLLCFCKVIRASNTQQWSQLYILQITNKFEQPYIYESCPFGDGFDFLQKLSFFVIRAWFVVYIFRRVNGLYNTSQGLAQHSLG